MIIPSFLCTWDWRKRLWEGGRERGRQAEWLCVRDSDRKTSFACLIIRIPRTASNRTEHYQFLRVSNLRCLCLRCTLWQRISFLHCFFRSSSIHSILYGHSDDGSGNNWTIYGHWLRSFFIHFQWNGAHFFVSWNFSERRSVFGEKKTEQKRTCTLSTATNTSKKHWNKAKHFESLQKNSQQNMLNQHVEWRIVVASNCDWPIVQLISIGLDWSITCDSFRTIVVCVCQLACMFIHIERDQNIH